MELGTLSAGVKLASALWDFAAKHLPFKSQKVSVSAFTYAAAGSEDGVLMVAIPLVFFHSGVRPVVIEALRLVRKHQMNTGEGQSQTKRRSDGLWSGRGPGVRQQPIQLLNRLRRDA